MPLGQEAKKSLKKSKRRNVLPQKLQNCPQNFSGVVVQHGTDLAAVMAVDGPAKAPK